MYYLYVQRFEISCCFWGELSYSAPLSSENISTPYFKQCFFRGGGITPQTESNTTPPSPKTNNKYCILYIEFCINNNI